MRFALEVATILRTIRCMKSLFGYGMILAVMVLFLGACASTQDATTTTQPATAVPGEKRDGGDVTPGMGPSGASANVHF